MKRFEMRELPAAIAHAQAGGQALHVCPAKRFVTEQAPGVFRRAAIEDGEFAHLLDQDNARLTATARKLGVRVIVIEREGTPLQHVDLVAGPLAKALRQAAEETTDERQGALAL